MQHLNDKFGKMAKSKGDFLTVSLLESKNYDPLVYRLFCLQSHYRKPLEFSYEVLDNVAAAYQKLLARVKALNPAGEPEAEQVKQYKEQFLQAVGNDLNTSSGLTVLYDVLKAEISDATKLALTEDFDRVLSLDLTKRRSEEQAVDAELSAYVEAKLAERKAAKKAKDFAKADAIREELAGQGILIKDTREGTVWEKA